MDALDHILSKFPNKAAMVVTATRELTLTAAADNTIPTGTTNIVDDFNTGGFGRITGTARSNAALTLRILQGPTSGGTMNVVTEASVPADATEGAGVGFTVEVVGEYCRIDVVNAGAETTTFSFEAHLRGV